MTFIDLKDYTLTLHRASPCGFYTMISRKGFAKTPFMWSLSISE